jgi:glutathione S-transferase
MSYVDLSMFQVMSGIEYAFPNGLARFKPKIPGLIFRRYPELDAAPPEG